MKYVFGVGADNKAPRTIDNVGLQYGLENLLNGTLTTDRFVDVNWRIGGMDIDGVWTPQRTAADEEALATLYRTGRIADGSGSANVAEIDARTNPTDVGFHPPFHSWSWRARIDRTLGNHDNNVIWVSRGGAVPSQFDSMRAWLDAVYADTSDDPLPAKIARNKPGSVRDTCYAEDAQGGPQEGPVLHGHGGAVAELLAHEVGRRLADGAGHVQVPAEAARSAGLPPSRRRAHRVHGRRVGRSCSRRSPRACATSRSPPSPTSRRFRGSRSQTDRAVVHWVILRHHQVHRRSRHHHKARLAGGARAAMRARAPPGTRCCSTPGSDRTSALMRTEAVLSSRVEHLRWVETPCAVPNK